MNVRPATADEIAQNAEFWANIQKEAAPFHDFEDSAEMKELRGQLDAGLISQLEFAQHTIALASKAGLI